MADKEIGTVEMARLLEVSKGYASLLKNGEKRITLSVARRLGALTGRPWHEYMPAEEAAQ